VFDGSVEVAGFYQAYGLQENPAFTISGEVTKRFVPLTSFTVGGCAVYYRPSRNILGTVLAGFDCPKQI
jgi:hypothetical protein